MKSLEDVVTSKFDRATSSILTNMTEPEILEVASQARRLLPERTKESIEALLRDAADDRIPKPEVLRLGGQRYPSVNAVLRHRELGMRTARRDYSKGGLTPLQTPIVESIGPSITFTGTSGDVNTVAWTPNGTWFAAGSACLVDSDSMQYNRSNNLLVGEVHRKALYEIPDHYTERERPETGVNSSHSMHVTQDHRLFQTVSMVAFSPDDSLLFTAGYDNQVRVYDMFDTEQPEKHFSSLGLRHTAKVDLLSVSPQGLLATGCQRSDKNSIKVIDPYLLNVDPSELFDEDGNKMKPVMHSFSSRRAAERPENGIFPSALCFDWSGDYLLAGFASTLKEEPGSGGTCLWDVRTGTQMTIFPETRNVFDVAWNTNRWKAPLFAVGCVAGAQVNRGVRSVVKLYDIRVPGRYTMPLELDCPALDMNDVLFSPYDENLIVAGCTNGKTYVWDIRQPRPETHLYSLMHGEPLMELGDDDPASRERLDTGIRFCSWAHDRRKLYTASSDGVVKTWDPYRAPEDVFVRDVVQLNSGVMSGAFSPDYASLLIGEVNGTINLLEAGQLGRSIKQMDTFNLISFKDEEAPPSTPDLQDRSPDKDSGASIARELVQTDQMTLRQMGSLPIRQAVQGPNYAGPYDKAADAPELRTAAAQFQRLHCDPPTQQCGLPACRLAAASIKAVPEEAGDSGRSADRIPAALRSLALAATPPIREDDADGNGNGTSSMPAKTTIALKCSKCHVRPARPRAETDDGNDDDDDEQGVSSPSKNLLPLCERCNFGCPRCGRKAGILSRALETTFAGVFCLRCRAVWRADVLGYKLVYQHAGKEDWDARQDEGFLYERARVMGIRRKVPPSPPSASGAAEASSPDGSGGGAAGAANTRKKRAKETQLEKEKRRGHDYLAEEGEDSIEAYYHGLWQDRPPSPL
ncbi:hypothetical protein SLS58_002337 [Diplodia intermedia]|uniref:Rik1-associated factor 1 n=1 Tax=Diplodia intermedia TaxID=856260 RepID=A0ABR3TZK0_9PEZI